MLNIKIISGGQTGADRTALEVAKYLNLETGGWAPFGYRTEDGKDLSLKEFGLKEADLPSYPQRTRLNVEEADGTLLMGDMESQGSKLTIKFCNLFLKPYLTNPTIGDFLLWIEKHNIKVLNVAGNRKSTNPAIVGIVREFLLQALGD